jgi:hypothetical protein
MVGVSNAWLNETSFITAAISGLYYVMYIYG